MLRNPYLNRSMIRAVGEFYGRTHAMQRVMARVGSATPQSVSIVGERRVGKSSLLWHIAQREVHARYLDGPDQYVFILLDFQRQQHLDQAGFCRVFGEHLQEALEEEGAPLSDFSALEQAVQRLERQGRRLVCLCDEFETVTRNTGFGSEFFGFLRSVANSYPVAFITASRRDLQSLCHTREIAESPFFNIFSQVPLGPLLPDETRALIIGPSGQTGLPLEPHVEAIEALSGDLPFFVQIACSAAFECLQERAGEPLDKGLLTERFLEEASSHFSYLWENFSAEEKAVVGGLAVGRAPPRVPELKWLEAHGYILSKAGQQRPFSAVFAEFLARNFPAEIEQTATPVVEAPPDELPRRRTPAAPMVAPLPKGERPFPQLVGESESMRRLFALMQRAVQSDATVLIGGETGCGKELVARSIHEHSSRKDEPFVAVNCGAIAETLQESELFGHKKGAFTDAAADRAGLFEEADGGTIFLDEIGEALPSIQVKLLRVLQEGEIRRVGESQAHKINVRLVCATNRDLEDEVAQGRFRADLYYRLYVLPLYLPPLRERREDIRLLIEHFLTGYAEGIGHDALEMLVRAEWPGNIRELENQLESARAMAGGEKIRADHLWGHLRQGVSPVGVVVDETVQAVRGGEVMALPPDMTLKEGRSFFERELIRQRLEAYAGDMERVAASLGVSRSRLYELIRRYGLKEESE